MNSKNLLWLITLLFVFTNLTACYTLDSPVEKLPISQLATPLCNTLPPLPQPPSNAKRVTDYGAIPNDGKDDTAAIKRALSNLKANDWLIFPRGRFDYNKYLALRTANTTLWGEVGATLFATNPNSMSLMIAADNIAIYNLTFQAKTTERKTAPWHTAISVFDDLAPTEATRRIIKGTVIRGNTITFAHSTKPGLTNSSSSAGIFLYRAQNFLVANNVIRRSLADGIHMTAGSRNGRVIGNIISQTGDDGIAVVSYSEKIIDVPLEQTTNRMTAILEQELAGNILIQDNKVSDIYWGRGISVVGGEHVTIIDNTANRSPGFAGIYLARETSYQTLGVNDILVKDNVIQHIQTQDPSYDFTNIFAQAKADKIVPSYHGGIEVYSHVLKAEALYPSLLRAYRVHHITLVHNRIRDAWSPAIRVGAPISTTSYQTPTGQVTYPSSSLTISSLSLLNNTFRDIAPDEAITVYNKSSLYCTSNLDEGVASSHQQCNAIQASPVIGAAFGFCRIE